jgi:succinate dehydrogenase / fumarate reductase flavoprotein subunit
MGGIDTDSSGRTRIGNLYAAGECACVSVHGANRLGGNSLLETVVFGRLVAEAINARKAETLPEPRPSVVQDEMRQLAGQVAGFLSPTGAVAHYQIAENLKGLLTEKVGIFRNEADLADAVGQIRQLREQYRAVCLRTPPGPFQSEVLHVLELEGLLYLGEITARGALARRESRGSHFRVDHPQRDDAQWLKHTIARLDGQEPRFSYPDVDTSLYEPEQRVY